MPRIRPRWQQHLVDLSQFIHGHRLQGRRHRARQRCACALDLALRPVVEALEGRRLLSAESFAPGSYLIDMGQTTQTVGSALKPYGLVYDMVTNFKVPINWAINPAKTTFRLDAGDAIPVDFTATTTTGTKSYSGGSFIIDSAFLTPAVIADVNTWKAQGVVVDTLAAPLTTEIYGQITNFPRAVLDAQNGALAAPYFTNAGVPASSYQIGSPTDLDHCDDVYILPHADPAGWSVADQQALYDFVNDGGGLWASCESGSELENLLIGGTTQMNFLSNGGLVPAGSHSNGTPNYSYNAAAANDPIMQIMNRLDAATQNGSERIYVPTSADWRSTTTVAVHDPGHPDNPVGGTSPFNHAAVVAYGNAFGDPTKGLVMYEAGHSLAGTAAANIAAQRAFFNFLLTEGIIKAPQPAVTFPTIVAGQNTPVTATISGGSGSYSYQWVSTSGGVFSQPAGDWNVGDPALTTQYLLTSAKDTVRLLVTDTCGRQGIYSTNLSDAPPTIDLDANNSSGATGADYKGYFPAGGAIVPAADIDTLITDNSAVIRSAAIKLTARPDGAAETLLINESLASSFGINVASDGAGGFFLNGAATLTQYQQVIASLQYTNTLPFPTTTTRAITVTVNDGISVSNTATSRLIFLGGSLATVNKQLYLSDSGQGLELDRVDPVATNDNSTSSVAVVPVVSPNSTGMATWSNSATMNLVYRPWNLTGYGTQATTAVDGGSYITLTSAASAGRNEAIVVGVTNDQHISGSIWIGTAWTPIAINVGGPITQNLGHPSQDQWSGAAVAYETNSGDALLVWNTGTTLNYSIWNGTSWTAAATIAAYTGVEPRQIRLAANPLAGSDEMVLVVTDRNEVDRALVWNGSAWGNQIQLDNDTGHNFTDVNVVYEQQSGRAMTVYASGTAGAVGYRLWDGSTWGAANTLAAPVGSNNFAQWTVVAGDPASNRIVLGVESNGKDAWMNVWSGAAWGTSTLGIQDGVTDNNNLGIAVAFETSSGDALAVYQNNEGTDTTELQFKTFTAGAWSAGTNFGSFASHETRAITLSSNPYSDQVQLLVNDDAKMLRSELWNGSSFASPIQLETNTNTSVGQPFSFFWDQYVPGAVTSTTTFTQTVAMISPFVMPAGGAVKVTTYIQLTSGSLPASPKLDAQLGQGGDAFLTINTSPTVTALGGGLFKLEWTGTVPNDVTVPTGAQISLTLIDFDSTYAFNILYDSSTYPSQVQVATGTGIAVDSIGIFGAAYPGGSPLTTIAAGRPAFVRFTVSDPFGASDITDADLVIKNSSNGTVLSTTLMNANVVASTAGSKTYEFAWTPPVGDIFTVSVTAHEGTEGVTATGQTTVTAIASPDLVVSKSDGGATVNAGGSVAYTINYSNAGLANASGVVLTEFLPTGSSFNSAGSTPGWVALGTGAFTFNVGSLAAGASGSVVFSVNVPTPVAAGLEQLANSVVITDDGTHGADSNPANNSGADATPVNAAPDLVITKTDGGTSTLAGGIVLYQIHYSNVGTQNADGVVITETLPANTTFNSTYSFGAWDSEGGGLFTLSVRDLAAGASGTVIFAVNVDSPLPGAVTQISDTVSIADGSDSGADLTPTDNTATDTTPIAANPQADLQITKTDGLTSVQPGGAVTYTITVTNAGPNPVTGAAFADNMPASLTGVSFTTAVAGGAAVAPGTGTGNSISGSLDLPVGGTVIYTVNGTLGANATGSLNNFATILPPAGILDPNTGNNTAVDSDPIVPVADLSLGKSFTSTDLDGSGTLTPGDRIVFALTVTNSGPNPAYNVSVEDLLPNGYQYVSDDAAIDGGTYSIGTGLWTIGSAIGATAANNTAVLHITAIVGPGGTYTNQAQVHGSDSFDPDSTPGNDVLTEDDFATVTPTVQPKSDLSLDKIMALTSDQDSNGILSIGDRVTFTLTLNNAGPNDAANVHVKDLLPAGFAFFSSAASQGTYTVGTGDWNVGTVSVLSTPTLSIVATVLGSKPVSAYTNSAQISASGSFDPDSTVNNDSTTEDDDASVTPPIADLSVTKTPALENDADESGTITFGDDVVFTVTVSNAGPDFATGTQVTDLLPSGFTYVSDDSSGTYDPITGLWNVGVMAPSTTQTLNITATVNPTGSYTNTAQVTASGHFDPDSTPNNNVASEDDRATVILTPGATPQADLQITKTDGQTNAVPGAPTTYTIVVSNNGPTAVSGASVSDALPAGATGGTWAFAGSTGGGGVTGPTSGTGALASTVDLPVGATVTFTYTVQTDSSATGSLSNTATVTAPASVIDPSPDNNSATDTDTLTPQADLAVAKTDGKTSAVPGTTTTYTITVTNNGPSTVGSLKLTDAMPAALLNPVFGSPSAGSYDSGTGVWSGLSLATGQSVTITLSGTIDPAATGSLTNIATVSAPAGTTDLTPGNDSATDTDTLTPRADLQITKTDGKTTVLPGTATTYTIVVSNNGSSAVSGASVSDPLPAGGTSASWTATANSGGGSVTGPSSGTGALATTVNLPVGATVTFTFTVHISSSAAGTLTNTATVSAPAGVTDPTPGNNSATDTDNVTGVQLVTDPCDPTKTALMVRGTSGNDTITIDKGSGSSTLKVTLNGVVRGTFAFTGNLYVFGFEGNDTITLASQISRDTFLYGGIGNDRITAGNGRNVVIGGDGNDTVTTGNGRDVLIGGNGADLLTAGNGEDLLVAGSTAYDAFSNANAMALCKLRDEWSRTDLPYAARINRLRGVTPGSPFVFHTSGAGQNVFSDTAVDRLTGGNDNDWFLGNFGGPGVLDSIDKSGSEIATDL